MTIGKAIIRDFYNVERVGDPDPEAASPGQGSGGLRRSGDLADAMKTYSVFIGLGSNLGERHRFLNAAAAELAGFRVRKWSGIRRCMRPIRMA